MGLLKKKIAVVTGIRSDYTGVYPVMKQIEKQDNMLLEVIVTGAHFIGRLKNVKEKLESEFKNIKYVDMKLKDDSCITAAKGLGSGIIGFAECFAADRPDFMLVFGDRVEALAAVEAAAVMNIPIAHIHAGDVSFGNVDESIRYTIARFAHIHFAATQNSARRLIQSGEEKWRVFVTGSPLIDNIKSFSPISKNEIMSKFKIKGPYALILQNPVTISLKESVESTKAIFDALSQIDIMKVVIYPNSDPGSEKIVQIIEKHKTDPSFRIYKNLDPVEYLSLLKYCVCLIGNSTSGIIEAPVFEVPFVNVGTRQKGRDASNNVIRVLKWDADIIKEIILGILNKKYKQNAVKNIYGKGDTAKRIVDILKKIKIDERLLGKSYHHLLDMEKN